MRTRRDRLDFEDLGEAALVDTLVVREIGKRLPLRAGQPKGLRPLLEPLAQQPGDVVEKETEGRSGRS